MNARKYILLILFLSLLFCWKTNLSAANNYIFYITFDGKLLRNSDNFFHAINATSKLIRLLYLETKLKRISGKCFVSVNFFGNRHEQWGTPFYSCRDPLKMEILYRHLKKTKNPYFYKSAIYEGLRIGIGKSYNLASDKLKKRKEIYLLISGNKDIGSLKIEKEIITKIFLKSPFRKLILIQVENRISKADLGKIVTRKISIRNLLELMPVFSAILQNIKKISN